MPQPVEPTFRTLPHSVKDIWGLIECFVEKWRRVSLNNAPQAVIPEVPTNSYSSQFPVSLVEWFHLSHAMRCAGCEELLGELVLTQAVPGHDALSLMLSQEGDSYWAVAYSDFVLSDPPVHRFVLRSDRCCECFEDAGIAASLVTEFVLTQIAYHVFPRVWVPAVPVAEETVDQMRVEFTSHVRLGNLWIFEAPSIAVFLRDNRRLIIGCQTSIEDSSVPGCIRKVLW